jgi:hypothetical protein
MKNSTYAQEQHEILLRRGFKLEGTRGNFALCNADFSHPVTDRDAYNIGRMVDLQCKTCKRFGALTPREKARGYHCADCTRAAEFGIS